MQIGPYQVHSIVTGGFALDGGAMFGTIPKVLWSKNHPADDQNRIDLCMRALLLKSDRHTILIDCGLGDKGGEKFKTLFKVDQISHNLEKSLLEHGLKPSDITDVILTHLHFDHAGGVTKQNANGEYVPTFPHARVHLLENNLKTAKHPNPREKASYLKEIYEPLEKQGCFVFSKSATELFPNVRTFCSNAHTEAQQLVWVEDEKTALFYAGDLIPTMSHVPLPWVMGYDLHPLEMMREKEDILNQLIQKKGLLFYEHDPLMAASLIVKTERSFEPINPLKKL